MYLKRCHTAMIFFGQKQLTAKKLLFPQKKIPRRSGSKYGSAQKNFQFS